MDASALHGVLTGMAPYTLPVNAVANGPGMFSLRDTDGKVRGFFGMSGDWGGARIGIADGDQVLWKAP
jgi:hypothetical protein